MKTKLEITEQDVKDIAKTHNLIGEAAYYIEEIVGSSNIEEHHDEMMDAISVAQDWLSRIITKTK